MRRVKIDLSDFETRIRVRQLRLEDYDEWKALLTRCFPTLKPPSRGCG